MKRFETYLTPADLPAVVPVFPLADALLLPRGELPLNIFEQRYLAMVDDVLAGERVVGMIQPAVAEGAEEALAKIGTAGRLTAFSETGDGRYLITLTGIARFQIVEEVDRGTPYRTCRIDAAPFAADFQAGEGEAAVNRDEVLATLSDYVEARDLEIDWDSINEASNEALVNGLSMLCPYGPRAKQALLEATDLATRAELLVALTERDLGPAGEPGGALQ
jgi:hypothetical protein